MGLIDAPLVRRYMRCAVSAEGRYLVLHLLKRPHAFRKHRCSKTKCSAADFHDLNQKGCIGDRLCRHTILILAICKFADYITAHQASSTLLMRLLLRWERT